MYKDRRMTIISLMEAKEALMEQYKNRPTSDEFKNALEDWTKLGKELRTFDQVDFEQDLSTKKFEHEKSMAERKFEYEKAIAEQKFELQVEENELKAYENRKNVNPLAMSAWKTGLFIMEEFTLVFCEDILGAVIPSRRLDNHRKLLLK